MVKTKIGTFNSNFVGGAVASWLVGSLRIDDFRTTAPLGHLIVPRRRPVEIEFTIRIKDDDVFARPATFSPFLKFVFIF